MGDVIRLIPQSELERISCNSRRARRDNIRQYNSRPTDVVGEAARMVRPKPKGGHSRGGKGTCLPGREIHGPMTKTLRPEIPPNAGDSLPLAIFGEKACHGLDFSAR